jgi:shikimate kinase
VRSRDTDHDIEASQGKRIPDIFVEEGEAHFRTLEEAAVATALAEHDGVLALGGGAILSEATRALLAQHRPRVDSDDRGAVAGARINTAAGAW